MSFLIAIEDLAKAVKAAEIAVSNIREVIAIGFRTRPPSPYHSISLCVFFFCVCVCRQSRWRVGLSGCGFVRPLARSDR